MQVPGKAEVDVYHFRLVVINPVEIHVCETQDKDQFHLSICKQIIEILDHVNNTVNLLVLGVCPATLYIQMQIFKCF